MNEMNEWNDIKLEEAMGQASDYAKNERMDERKTQNKKIR
jgi:hypothetical protein